MIHVEVVVYVWPELVYGGHVVYFVIVVVIGDVIVVVIVDVFVVSLLECG